ncbi:MAG: hypothetical protein PWP23_2029 [Candidatus Sumerlaeota bacterium]|nr:hypothetical protein [Candidatus Sumerlaeota bacterium]
MLSSLRFLVCCAAWIAAAAIVPAIDSAGIDAALEQAQTAAGVQPAGRADDAEFLRRLTLDVRGRVPSIEETVAFLKDDSPHKRTDAIEAALASPERGENWAAYWDKVLLGTLDQPQSPEVQYAIKSTWRAWAAEQFNANRPWDAFMTETVAARGRTDEAPEALPIARWQRSPESMAGTMSRAFLGNQIQCAQCHDHKTNPELTQQKFWEFTAFFSNTRAIPVRPEPGAGMQRPRYAVEVADIGPKWGVPIPDVKPAMEVTPHYLDGTPARQRIVDASGRAMPADELRQHYRTLARMRNEARKANGAGNIEMATELMQKYNELPEVRDTRRDQLAEMIATRDQQQFAANFVNRLWARFFGRGFVEPVDGWGEGAEAVHPELLEALTADFIASGYDIRALERTILNTRAYQRSPRPAETGADASELFAHAAVRPLSPDQLLASLIEVTRTDAARSPAERQRFERLQMRYASQFVHVFGNDEMEWTSTFEPSIPRALFLMNDKAINAALRGKDGEGVVQRIAMSTDDPQEQARYLYLAILSREPETAERVALAGELRDAAAQSKAQWQALVEDAAWALMNSTEFLTNH